MASPNTSWTDILTTTLYARQPTIADNMLDQNALLKYMKAKGRRRSASGGVSLVEHLEYADSTNAQYISGYEPFAIAAQELFTSAEFAWKEAICAVTISGLEMGQNADSPTRMLDLLESRVRNAEKSLMNMLAAGIYSDGTGTSSKQVGGLQLLVADTPTSGTVGGIDRQSYTFWRNYYLDACVSGAGSVSTTNIQSSMNTMLVNTTRGNDRTQVIFMDNNYYTKFLGSLQTIQRISRDTEVGEAGFQKLMYAGIDVVLDGGVGGNCPSNHAYFLNLDYLSYRPHSDYEFVTLGDRHATNQNALVRHLYWMGNMTLSNAFCQGVMKH